MMVLTFLVCARDKHGRTVAPPKVIHAGTYMTAYETVKREHPEAVYFSYDLLTSAEDVILVETE